MSFFRGELTRLAKVTLYLAALLVLVCAPAAITAEVTPAPGRSVAQSSKRAVLNDPAESSDRAAAEPSLPHPTAQVKPTTPPKSRQLAVIDWLVVAAYGVGMLGVGWYYSRRTKTTEDYLLGGRRMKPFNVGLSLFATLISTISYLAVPGEILGNGPVIMASLLGFPVAFVVIGWFIIPYIMKLKVTSAYEILEKRLGPTVRLTGALLFLSLRLLWMALIVYATTDKVLIPFIGIDPRHAPWVGVGLCIATIAYTSMGGLRAVVLTDAIQSLILFGAAVASVLYVSQLVGGVENWWPHSWQPHWQTPKFWFDPNVRVTVAGFFLNGFLWWLCTNGADQMAIQRFLSTRDAPAARRVMAVAIVADAVVIVLLALLGFALLAYVRIHPEFIPSGKTVVTYADQVFPDFIVTVLPAGITGFVVAGLLSAAMSSLSSGLSAGTSVIMADIVGYLRKTPSSEAAQVRWAKWISLGVGFVVVTLSLGVGQLQGNLIELANKVSGLLTAPLFVLFFMALWIPWATAPGTLFGTAVATAVSIAVSIFEIGGLSFLWILPLSLGAGLPAAMLASLLPIGSPPRPLLKAE